jgi:hypothetical protein
MKMSRRRWQAGGSPTTSGKLPELRRRAYPGILPAGRANLGSGAGNNAQEPAAGFSARAARQGRPAAGFRAAAAGGRFSDRPG